MRTKIIWSVVGVLFLLTLAYGVFVEPQWIEVTQFTISAPVAREFSIVQISDLHTHGLGSTEERLLKIISEIDPDIILLTGDVSSPRGTSEDYFEVLSRLKARIGIYAVRGNWEYWAAEDDFEEILTRSGVQTLDNESVEIAKNLWLIGFDDAVEGTPSEESALQGIPEGAFRLAIFHSPSYFDQIHEKVNLALSGHTHGGQVRIPYLDPIWLPHGSSSYVNGWYRKGESSMYVSRGIGTSIFPIRLFCRPEVTLFKLQKPLKAHP